MKTTIAYDKFNSTIESAEVEASNSSKILFEIVQPISPSTDKTLKVKSTDSTATSTVEFVLDKDEVNQLYLLVNQLKLQIQN